jgi:hypothetical protein
MMTEKVVSTDYADNLRNLWMKLSPVFEVLK